MLGETMQQQRPRTTCPMTLISTPSQKMRRCRMPQTCRRATTTTAMTLISRLGTHSQTTTQEGAGIMPRRLKNRPHPHTSGTKRSHSQKKRGVSLSTTNHLPAHTQSIPEGLESQRSPPEFSTPWRHRVCTSYPERTGCILSSGLWRRGQSGVGARFSATGHHRMSHDACKGPYTCRAPPSSH